MKAVWPPFLVMAGLLQHGQCWGETITVSTGGEGKFKSIQEAIDSVADGNTNSVVIEVAPGEYEERVTVPRGKDFLTLRGMGKSREDVKLVGGAGKRGVLSTSANDFRAENFTIENTAGPTAGPNMALFCDGKRQVFENLLIKGWQDTLGSWNGNVAYFKNCEIWGSVDFIYSGGTALFDQCDVLEIRDTGGPIAAPSTPKEVEFGLVFLNCRLLKGPGVAKDSSTLMRPWRGDGHTAFIHCRMADHITAKGWSEWDGREQTCRAVEFGSRTLEGRPIDLSSRASWARLLTPQEAVDYNLTNILGGWIPAAQQSEVPAMRE